MFFQEEDPSKKVLKVLGYLFLLAFLVLILHPPSVITPDNAGWWALIPTLCYYMRGKILGLW